MPVGLLSFSVQLASYNAPILTLNSQSAGLITVNWDVDKDVTAALSVSVGDTLTRQVQTAGGNWSSLLDNTAHILSSAEEGANLVSVSQYQAPSSGSYDIRGYLRRGATGRPSPFSNTLTVVVP